jgi:hypothetical protein
MHARPRAGGCRWWQRIRIPERARAPKFKFRRGHATHAGTGMGGQRTPAGLIEIQKKIPADEELDLPPAGGQWCGARLAVQPCGRRGPPASHDA